MKSIALLICCVGLAAAVDLQAKYSFSSVLLDQGGQYYALYWNFTRSTESIYFAVNVSTTGWVGFGLSPNGQMPGSDVVMGWVSNGQGFFWDRYAEGRFTPVIDAVSQDWFLTNSEEANGYTVLEFSRNFTSCDPQDLDITSSTARVVWSFNSNDPTDPSGSDAMQHEFMGSRSLNLLSGLPSVDTSDEEDFLEVLVDDVTIPSDDTTYWCASYQLPSALVNTTHYITRISPVVTPHAASFVHHMLVYLCRDPLSAGDVGASDSCRAVDDDVSVCLRGLLIGAWAVGGEDFIYPDGIAYPVGGIGEEHFVVMQVHYDNPGRVAGVVDNSGLRFYYTTQARAQSAGIMYLGHSVTDTMLVPPRTRNYTIAGICAAECTSAFIPEDGLRIFATLLHTHVAGRGLTIHHYRPNPDCGVLEELEPIDQNLNYDFNFQQFSHLRREHVVKPGDILVLKCDYTTVNIDEVLTGGESTLEEMCLSFPVFYPRAPDGSSLVNCASSPDLSTSFNDFLGYLDNTNPTAAQQLRAGTPDSLTVLNGLSWTSDPQLAISLQDSVQHGTSQGFCSRENGEGMLPRVTIPEPECSYEAPNRCSEDQPMACCDRLAAGATRVEISLGMSFLVLLCARLL